MSIHPLHPHPHGKRPFDDCGSPMSVQPNPEARNKRARSTSSADSDPASSSGYNTAPDAAMADPQPDPEDSLRTSLQRFAEFDRQIAALRTSLAGARSPPDTNPPLSHPPRSPRGRAPPSPAFVRDDATRVHPRSRRSLSPLVFPPNPSVDDDEVLLDARTHRSSHHSGEHSRFSAIRIRPYSFAARVVREPSTEREPVPSVFDVFNIADSSQDRNRPSLTESVPPRVPIHHNERARRPAPTTSAAHANQALPQDFHLRRHPSWTSIPSSNSLMSESASERRHVLAMEHFHRRSSFDVDDEPDSPWSGSSRGERDGGHDVGVPSPVPPSPSVDSMPGTTTSTHFPFLGATHAPLPRAEPMSSSTFQRTLSELLGETERGTRDQTFDDVVLDWDLPRTEQARQRERQRERAWVLDLERGRSFQSGSSLASTSSARDESSHPVVPAFQVPSRTGQGTVAPNATTTTNNGPQYSYSNLNLSSFQSGLFRDSLRRNAEVDQVSFPASAPVIPIPTPDSRATSRLGMEDSGSDMELDDFVEHRLRYAGRTPPPDYVPPPRTTSPLPNFSVLRRNNLARYDPQPPQPNRNSMFPRPMPPVPPVPPAYENNHHPAPAERAERTDRFLPARILESLYRSHEDGRRNASAGTRQPYPPAHQSHVPSSGPRVVPRSDATAGPRSASSGVVGENRRTSLLGGSLRSRFARFANAQSSTNTSDVSTSRQRSPPRPIGARPQAVEQQQRRMSVFGGAPVVEQEPRAAYGPQPWAVDPSMAPWRAASGPRNGFVPPPPASSDGTSRGEEQRSRLRTLRQRLQLDRGSEGMRVFRPGMLRAMGRRGNLGDYVPDELFDDSYEALLSLSSMLGDVRSRATPEEVIASLPTGTFKEWKRDDSESRCPICLDDYEPMDVLTKLVECTHWLHKHCLEQWLRTANTCPVCREKVKPSSPKPAPARRRQFRDLASSSATNQGASTGGRTAQANNGRPMTFSAVVFDRLMNEARDDSWTPSSSQAPPLTRADIMLHHLRQPPPPPPPPREYQQAPPYASIAPPHDGFYQRVPPAPPRGSGLRPLMLLGQGSDSSGNMVVDEGRRLATVEPGAAQRRDPVFPYVAPPAFQPQAVDGMTEWRSPFAMENSRSSSSSSSSSASAGMASRIPVDEDGAFEDFVFGWSVGRAT